MDDPFVNLIASREQALLADLPVVEHPLDILTRSKQEFLISDADQDLWEQINANPNITDLADDIAFLRFTRARLQESLRRRGSDLAGELASQIMRDVRRELIRAQRADPVVLDLLEESLRRSLGIHFPRNDLTVKDAEALQKITRDIGQMAKQYQDIASGIKVIVDFRENHLGAILRILYETVPHQYLMGLVERLEVLSPAMGTEVEVTLD